MPRLPALTAAAALATLAAPPATHVAHAQRKKPDDLTTRAKQHVADGLAAQDAGDFATAIAEYERAYRLVPHPEILFNLGQAHRLDGQPAQALAYYRRYLAIEPDGRVAADARRWIGELEPIVGDTDDTDDALPVTTTESPTERMSPPPNPGRPYLYAGVSCIGLGLTSVGMSAFFGLEARKVDRTLSNHDGPWTDDLLAEQDRGRALETRSIVFGVAGGALVVGGAALVYVAHHKYVNRPQSPSWTIAPILDSNTTGLALIGALP